MLSRDPYLVANWPVMKNFGVVSKLFLSHLIQEKVHQVRYVIGFGMSRDPYLVSNRPILCRTQLNSGKVRQVCHWLLGCHVTPILLLIGQFWRTWAWWTNYSGVISIRRRSARYVFTHWCHVTPILLLIGQFWRTWVWWENYSGVISIGRRSPRYVIGFMLSRDPYLVANWPVMKNFGVVSKLFLSHLIQEKVHQVRLVIGFGMSRDPYLVANRPILCRSQLNSGKVRQVCHWFQAVTWPLSCC
jgi:hypothetical protein